MTDGHDGNVLWSSSNMNATLHKFTPDSLPYIGAIHAEVGEEQEISKVSDPEADSDQFAIVPGGNNNIKIGEHRSHTFGEVLGHVLLAQIGSVQKLEVLRELQPFRIRVLNHDSCNFLSMRVSGITHISATAA